MRTRTTGHRLSAIGTVCSSLLALAFAMAGCSDTISPNTHAHWSQLVAGASYTCGLTSDSAAFCWGGVAGYFDPGPIRDSVAPNSAVPLRVPGNLKFIDLVVGSVSTCARDAEHMAYCWGGNLAGELGTGSGVARLVPAPVTGGLHWRALAMEEGVHTCGIDESDITWCWGNQFRGAVGNGQVDGTAFVPMRVLNSPAFASIYAGVGNSCGLTDAGDAFCWGVNDFGLLGDGTPPREGAVNGAPTLVAGSHHFVSLALGAAHACGIDAGGVGWCWGWNRAGQLGNGGTDSTSVPTEIAGQLRWKKLVVGYGHTCGLATDATTFCWGQNDYGQLGLGSHLFVHTPQKVAAPDAFADITAGQYHTCARDVSGNAYCWGRGDYGQLGSGTMIDESWPTLVYR